MSAAESKIWRSCVVSALYRFERPRRTSAVSCRKATQFSGKGAEETLLFRIYKTSLGGSHIGEATPRDDCLYAKSNANTFVRARGQKLKK